MVLIRGTWDWDLSRGIWQFQNWLGAWIHWSWHKRVWEHQLKKVASGNNRKTPYKDACLQWGNSEGVKVFFFCTSVLDLLKYSQWFMHHHLYQLTLKVTIQMTSLQVKWKSLFLLKLAFVCHLKFSVNFSYAYLSTAHSVLSKKVPISHCNYEKICFNYVTLTNVTTSEPPTMQKCCL